MTAFLIVLGLVVILLVIWMTEARLFLFLFHRLFFRPRAGMAIHLERLAVFPESQFLESHWENIFEELNQVMRISERSLPKFHEVDKSNHKISFDEGPAWRTVVIKAYDGWFIENCMNFPLTTELLRDIPVISTAMFSILEPGVMIPMHTGKFSGLWRYHLALSVPRSPNCFMEVNGIKYHWKEGEGILFNDTYLHSVTNATEEFRIVLFLDIKKKASPAIEMVNSFILWLIRISPVFRKAIRNGKIG